MNDDCDRDFDFNLLMGFIMLVALILLARDCGAESELRDAQRRIAVLEQKK